MGHWIDYVFSEGLFNEKCFVERPLAFRKYFRVEGSELSKLALAVNLALTVLAPYSAHSKLKAIIRNIFLYILFSVYIALNFLLKNTTLRLPRGLIIANQTHLWKIRI